MIAAREPVQRPSDARLLAIDARGRITHWPRGELAKLLRPGDLVVANDAATLPASLHGVHVPALARGDAFELGPLRATVRCALGHPRFIALRFDGTPQQIWRGLATHGRPIQYAHMPSALALWDVWTPVAGVPAAFEPPSAGFALDWALLATMRKRGVAFATITHAAGISSTGDAALDARLPLDEPYRISRSTADALARTRLHGGRVIAIGTTVVRALEAAGIDNGLVRAGAGIATQRITSETRLRVADAIVSGTHEPGTSHYALLSAFVSAATLRNADRELLERGYRTHEFGDSVLVERCFSRSEAWRDHTSAIA
jgi:S-adenosylmethionine:tRNA ribosyltransferase-isomerase